MDAAALQEAERFFREKIPLTRAMGVRVIGNDESGFTIEAPVALNHNHLHTAFAGSINAVATLAGYGLLWLELRDRSAVVVVAESTIRYLRPLHQTIRATCVRPPPPAFEPFSARLQTAGKSRIALTVIVEDNGQRAADFQGTFVASVRGYRADA